MILPVTESNELYIRDTMGSVTHYDKENVSWLIANLSKGKSILTPEGFRAVASVRKLGRVNLIRVEFTYQASNRATAFLPECSYLFDFNIQQPVNVLSLDKESAIECITSINSTCCKNLRVNRAIASIRKVDDLEVDQSVYAIKFKDSSVDMAFIDSLCVCLGENNG